MGLSQEQIADLEELECLLAHAVDMVLRSPMGTKILLGDRARILLLQVIRERLKNSRHHH